MDLNVYLSIMSKCINYTFRSKSREVTINSLPDELLLHIFQFLPLEDVVQCELVCRRWRKLATDTGLWRRTEVVCSGQRGRVCPKTISILKSHCEILGHLKIQYILKYPFLRSLAGICMNLLSLEMIMCRIQVELEEDIKKWPNLKKLNLRNSMLKSDRPLLLPLDHFKQLTFLGLSDFGLTTENCYDLLKCTHLNHILIDKIKDLPLDYMKTLISNKRHTLKTFHIYGGDAIDDECLILMAQCSKLQDLSIIRCENLTDRALDGVVKMESLTNLQLWNSVMFSEAKLQKTFAHDNLRKLVRLSLSKVANITIAVVDIISEHCTNLAFLSLYQCPRLLSNDYEKQLKAKLRHIHVLLY